MFKAIGKESHIHTYTSLQNGNGITSPLQNMKTEEQFTKDNVFRSIQDARTIDNKVDSPPSWNSSLYKKSKY